MPAAMLAAILTCLTVVAGALGGVSGERGGGSGGGTFVDLRTVSSGDTVRIDGRTSPGATVTVDGEAVEVDADGTFSLELPATGGRTTVQAVAVGTDGGRATATTTVG